MYIIIIVYIGVFGVWFVSIRLRHKQCPTERWESARNIRRKEYAYYGRKVYAFWVVDGVGTLAEILLIPIFLWQWLYR